MTPDKPGIDLRPAQRDAADILARSAYCDPRAGGLIWFVDFPGSDAFACCESIDYFEYLSVPPGERKAAPRTDRMDCYRLQGVRRPIGTEPKWALKVHDLWVSKGTAFSAAYIKPPAWWSHVLENPTPERILAVLQGHDPSVANYPAASVELGPAAAPVEP